MKPFLRVTGLAGFLVFAAAFAATFLSPLHYERMAEEMIRREVEAGVRERMGAYPTLAAAAGLLAARYEEETAALGRAVEARVAAGVARMQDPDCPCRRMLEEAARYSEGTRFANLARAQPQLDALIAGNYAGVVRKLMADLRIFTGVHAAVFAFLLVASFARPRAVAQLFVPAVLLLAASAVTGAFYLFGRDWLSTILFDDYTGYAYAAYLAAVFLLIAEVVLNRARLTTRALNGILDALGSTVSVLPC